MDATRKNASFAHVLPFGAELLDGGRARFRVWAPSAQRAAVVFDGDHALEMAHESSGWFSIETACARDRAYRYRFDDAEPVPDPASRAQNGGIDGASLVIDARTYPWRNPDWRGRPWHEAVIYELHVGVCGGFEGVRARLAGLRDLGVTVIEL